jgi:hypothetical protein
MENINYFKQIPLLWSEYEQLEKDRIVEVWEAITSKIIFNIYTELCSKIHEVKMIPIGSLFDKTIHPLNNKTLLMDKLNNIVYNKDRLIRLSFIVNDIWNKIMPLCRNIDIKYTSRISDIQSNIFSLEQNNNVDILIDMYKKIITENDNIESIEKAINDIKDPVTKDNIMELLNNTKNIIKCDLELKHK